MRERREAVAASLTVADPLPITLPVAVPLTGSLTAPTPGAPQAERIAVLRSNESWWRSAWVGLKAGVIGALGFWGITSLVDPEPIKPIGLVLFGLVSATLAIGTRRTGQVAPSVILRVGGAAVSLIGLGVAAAGLASGEKDPAILGAFFAVMGTVGVVIGVRLRRQERSRSANLEGAHASPVRLPRAELVRRVELERARMTRELRTMRRAVTAFIVTAVALFGLAQIPAVGAFMDGLPEWVWMLVFFGFWSIAIGGMLGARRKERRDAVAAGLLCPNCSQPLLGTGGNLRFVKLIEDEGLCPQCGVLIVEDVPA